MKQESTPKRQLKLNSEVITQLNSTGGGGSSNCGGGGSFILCTVVCNSVVCSVLCGCGC
ncbi:MAG TPA: hypothetical protein VGE90_07845 [Chitinophaga sp.]